MEIIEQFLQKHRKPILIIITLIIAGFIGYNVAVLISRIGKLPVTVMYAPFDAEVVINGKNYKNNQVYYFAPGNYQVEVNREHFETMTAGYTIEKDSKDNYFVGSLAPSDDEGTAIASERIKEFLKVESIGGIDAENQANQLLEEAPIAKFLPINFKTYSVSYDYDEQGKFFIELVLKKGVDYSSQAIATLYSINNGEVDPASYKIIVRDYKDSFGEFEQNSETDLVKYLETGYKDTFENYQVLTNRIVNQDDYYGVLIVPSSADLKSDTASYPVYRAILKKEGTNWKLISTPYFVVSQYNAAEVPVDFLNQLNRTFVEVDI